MWQVRAGARARPPAATPPGATRSTRRGHAKRWWSHPAPLPDLELRERAGDRGFDRGDFFVGDLVVETCRGALPRLFDPGLLELIRRKGHVGRDRDAIGGDLGD